jgi:hypothetical protein
MLRMRPGSGVYAVRLAALPLLVWTSSFMAAPAPGPLFPHPLHLVRRIESAIGGTRTTIDEYCEGNRMVSVRGDRISIADLSTRQLTEIDRAAGTFAITSLDAMSAVRVTGARSGGHAWRRITRLDRAETFALDLEGDEDPRLEAAIDRSITVRRAALELLLGVEGGRQVGAMVDLSRMTLAGAETSSDSYALPVLQVLVAGGKEIETNTVIAVDEATVRLELLVIDRSFRRVEPERVRQARELLELDALPSGREEP